MVKKIPNRKKARRVLADETPMPTNGPVPGGSDGAVQMHAGRIIAIWKRQENLAAELKAARKAAIADGIKIGEFLQQLKLREVATEIQEENIKISIRYARLLGSPIGTQTSLLDDLPPMPSPTDVVAKAQNDGKRAGLMGQPAKDNPHMANTEAWQSWEEWWNHGNDERKTLDEMIKRKAKLDAAEAKKKADKKPAPADEEEMADAE